MKRVQGDFWAHSVRKCERNSSKQQEEGIRNAVDQVKSQNKLHNSSASHSSETFRNAGSSNRGQGLPHNTSAGRGQQTNYGFTRHSHRHMAQPPMHDGRSVHPPQRVQSAPLAARTARGSYGQWPCDNTHFMSKPGPSSTVKCISQGRSTQPPGNAGVSQAAGVRQHSQVGPSQDARLAQEHQLVQTVRGHQGSKKPAQWQEKFVPQSNRQRTGFSQHPNFVRPPTRAPVGAQGSGQTAPLQTKCGAAWLPNRHLSPSHSQFGQTQSHGTSRHFNRATPQANRHYICPPSSQAGRLHEVEKPTHPCFKSSSDVGRKWSQGRPHWHGQQSFRFKVVSYNVLADHLLHSNRNLYRSAESWPLEWEYRKKNLLQELLHYQADILCLQEVQEEHFHGWFQPKLEQAGYSGLYKKRTGDKPDGCATFFKNSAFTLVSSQLIEFKKEGVPLMDRDNIAIIALLRPLMRQAGRKFVAVVNTHLLFNKKRGDIKLAQLACLFAELHEISKASPPRTSSRKGGPGGDTPHTQHCPVILCGDFNCTPFNPLYDFVTKGKLNYHGLSKMALSGQSSHQHFPRNSVLFSNVIPWELGISLTCKKRQDHGDVSTPSQQDCVSEANERVGLESANVGDSCQGSEITQMRSNTSLPLGKSDILTSYKSCTSIEHGLQLQSVYQHYYPDGQPEVTTFHDSACCTVDYIHYSAGARCQRCKVTHGQLELAGKLTLLTEGQINSFGGLPCRVLSSDHLSLVAGFVFHV